MADEDNAADDSESFGSLVNGQDIDSCSIDNGDDDEALEDNWIEELECALLAECDPVTLKKICEGKKIPANLRPDYWRTLLSLNDAERVKLTSEYDLLNQAELRHDCELLVDDISKNVSPEPLADVDILRLRSDFETTLTTYVIARPELEYVSGNGWTDILKVLYNLQLTDIQMYQMFFRIVDRYIPKDLSPTKRIRILRQADRVSTDQKQQAQGGHSPKNNQQKISQTTPQTTDRNAPEKSVQAYHLLRLLIQYHDPELCSILDSRKVTPNLYVKDWFCSLFARSCPSQLALYIWDMHFKMADPFLIFFAAIVMVVNASDELKKSNPSQQDMLDVLKSMPSKLEEDDIEDLYYLVSNHYTYSTPRSIRSYSHLFFMDTFGNTYSGNDSPDRDGSPTLVDPKTTRLTRSIDLSQYLCLPIVPAELFASETASNQQQAQQQSTDNNSISSNDSPQQQNSKTTTMTSQHPRYFLVDCRPADQYNAGHLNKAFHLDCSLMLREPSSFATAVKALLEIQRQVVASNSNTGGQHLCFIGSGQEEEDQYVNMVVASFLQKYQKYVSIVFGGFDAIHDYVKTKSELSGSFSKYIVDHNESACKACLSGHPEEMVRMKIRAEMETPRLTHHQASSLSSALFSSTSGFFKSSSANNSTLDKTSSSSNNTAGISSSSSQATVTAAMLAQSGASMFDKFTTAFVSKSSVLKDRLVETINNTAIPNSAYAAARSHVSEQDKLGPRYMGSGSLLHDASAQSRTATVSNSKHGRMDHSDTTGMLSVNTNDMLASTQLMDEEPCQEVQIDIWQKENDIMSLYKCAQIKGTNKYPGFIALNKTHLWILREIPHNKGFVSIAAKRPIDMIVQITSKRKQPDFIIFRYGNTNDKSAPNSPAPSTTGDAAAVTSQPPQKGLPTIIASDNLHIPQAFEVIRLIKREIVRIMDETSRKSSVVSDQSSKPDKADADDQEVSDVTANTADTTTTTKTTTTTTAIDHQQAGHSMTANKEESQSEEIQEDRSTKMEPPVTGDHKSEPSDCCSIPAPSSTKESSNVNECITNELDKQNRDLKQEATSVDAKADDNNETQEKQ